MKNVLNIILDRELESNRVDALGLSGSYATGRAGRYSDVDIIGVLKEGEKNTGSIIEIIQGVYVVRHYYHVEDLYEAFSNPVKATEMVDGMRELRTLYDPHDLLKVLIQRANNFSWSPHMQKEADRVSGDLLLSWVEEVNKSLQGVIYQDVGRMLNGIFGVTYGMFKVLIVKHGILLKSENDMYLTVRKAYQHHPYFLQLSCVAFGIEGGSLYERTIAGLKLFLEVVDRVAPEASCETDLLLTKEEVKGVLLQLKEYNCAQMFEGMGVVESDM